MLEPTPLPPVISASQPQLSRTPPMRRWLRMLAVALAAVVGVAGVAAGGALVQRLLSGQSTDEARAGYAYLPSATTVVVEARLDLPAGQDEQLAVFLSRFPGFGDDADVEGRLEELLNDALREQTDGRANFVDDVAPWLVGWVISGARQNVGGVLQGSGDGRGMAVAGVSDRAAAEAAMLQLRSTDMEWLPEEFNGAVIWSGLHSSEAGGQAYTVTDDALLFADTTAQIEAALGVRSGAAPSLLESSRFAEVLRRAPPGRLGLVWADVDGMGLAGLLERLTGDNPIGRMIGPACGDPVDALPRDVLATLQLRDGRAVVDVAVTLREALPAGSLRASGLADRVPADAFFYAEARDVGAAFTAALACLRDVGERGGLLKDIEEATGELDDLLGWATDVGLALRFDGERMSGGLVAHVDDPLRAAEALGQLRAFLTAGAGELGEVVVTEEDYRGVRLVSFAFSDGEAVQPAPAPLPTLAYALSDDLLVIGVDANFARAVIDTADGAGLAAAARFSRALDFANGRLNRGLVYVDLSTATALYDTLDEVGPDRSSDSDEFHDYLAALDDLLVVAGGEGTSSTLRIVLSPREAP